jgi:hypothetical protein
MSQAKVERAVEIMNANKLHFHKNFPKIYGIGHNDDAMENLCTDILNEIEKILIAGVNCGFSANMKKSLLELTTIAQKTCSDGFVKVRIDGLYTKKNACLAALSLPDMTGAPDLRENLKAYVASSRAGMDVLKNDSFNRSRAELGYETSCEKLLEDVKKAADTVIDFSGAEAVEKYNNIITKLRTWRTSVARSGGFYDANTLSPLREILRETRAWSDLCRTPAKKADEQDILPLPDDDLTRVIESETTRQSVEMFFRRCDDYVYAVYEMSNTGVADKVRELRASIAEARGELQKVENDRNRGRISQNDYEYYNKRIQNDIDMMEFDLSRIQLDDYSRNELQLRREMISRIEQPIRSSYNHVKSNRIHVHNLFSGMDFSRIIALLNNNLNANEMEAGIADIQNTLVARGFIDRQGNVLLENIRFKLGSEYNSAWNNN